MVALALFFACFCELRNNGRIAKNEGKEPFFSSLELPETSVIHPNGSMATVCRSE